MDSNKASYPELIISPFARVLTFVAKLCAALFSRLPPPANQRMRRQSKCQKGLIARLLLLQPLHSANPIIEPTFSNPIIEPNFSQTIFPISIKLTRTQFGRANQRRCSSVVWFSHHLSPLVGKGDSTLCPLWCPLDRFSQQLSYRFPARLN